MSKLIEAMEALQPEDGDSTQFCCGYYTARKEAIDTIHQHEAERQEKLREAREHVYRILCLGENSTIRQVATLALLDTLLESPQMEGQAE